MALVMLPCELPWWSVVVRKITAVENTNEVDKILEAMQKIHDLCNISLDPDEDHIDSTVLDGLRQFVCDDMIEIERETFLNHTLKIVCRFAKNLKNCRPCRGMNFSLQQNADAVEFEVKFVASLLANSFFSTYPKRTNKTHPTLKDFNFTHFFKELNTNTQKAKFRSFLWYFEWLDQQAPEELERKIKISRKIMSGKQWLTIEDWMECKLSLCPMDVKHDSRLENASESTAQIIFTQPAIGSGVLANGSNQESTQIITHPELLIILLFVESLEDNEVILAENFVQVSRIVDPKNKAIFERLQKPKMQSSMICMDAENYHTFSASQFEEDNCLRELNKCLLAFRQNTCTPMSSKLLRILSNQSHVSREPRGRLSPIGESFTTSNKSSVDCGTKIFVEPTSPTASTTTTLSSKLDSEDITRRRSWLNLPENQDLLSQNGAENEKLSSEEKRRGRFIVLGSSGECLPVNRQVSPKHPNKAAAFFANGDSEDEDDIFYSARNSVNHETDSDGSHEELYQRYSVELETPENRFRFAQQLKDALKLENGYTESTEDCSADEDELFIDDYAVDITIEGAKINDKKIKIKRETSTGFILEDEMSLGDCQMLPQKDIRKPRGNRNSTGNSSKYSFDTDESDIEEIYDQLAKWLNDPLDVKDRKLDSRDKAVQKFADSLLKRALSESFLGEIFDESAIEEIQSVDDGNIPIHQKRKMIQNFRSLSLEIAKHKHLLASQLKQHNSPEEFRKFIEDKVSKREQTLQEGKQRKWSITTKVEEHINCDVTIKLTQRSLNQNNNLRPVATGNWGCGQQAGDPQFKVVIQWLAASVANVPILVYYTCANKSLSKLDTLVRVLHDRKWTVGDLLRHTMFCARNILNNPSNNYDKNFCFFDKLIGLEKGN